MPSKKSDDQKLADQANELYWRSDQSVNQITETMDLSKSGLYALVDPFPAERPCPDCGTDMVYTNRTTKHKGVASCLACENELEAKPRTQLRRKSKSGPDLTVVPRKNGGRTWRSNRVLWASVLLGLAAGLYVTRRSR
jgi:hypothetical protein